MELISFDTYKDICILKMTNRTTNAINLDLVQELSKFINDVRTDKYICGLVLSSANEKFFSIGFDIPNLINKPVEDFLNFYRSFNQICIDIFTLPKPTIAAIPGHAIAGGCILALCCDYRFISDGRNLVGLNEIKLGVPIPYPADCILRQLVSPINARDIVNEGNFYKPKEAQQIGLVDRILPSKDLLTESINKISSFCAPLSLSAYAEIKQNRVEGVKVDILSQLKKKEEIFVQLWQSEETQLNLKKASEKF